MQTNFFAFGIPAETFQAQTLPYSHDALHRLRQQHNSEYSFFRYGDRIIASPHRPESPALGEYEIFEPTEHPSLVASLLRHILFHAFRENITDVTPTGFSPLEFHSRKASHDPTFDLLPETLRSVIAYPRVVQIAVQSVDRAGGPRHGLLVSFRNRWHFPLDMESLKNDGFKVTGREVLSVEPLAGLTGVLAPRENLLGIVREVSGSTAIIETNAGTIERPLAELALRRSRSQIGDFLRFKIGDVETRSVFARVKAHGELRGNPDHVIGEIRQVGRWLSRLDFRNGDNFVAFVSGDNVLHGPSFRMEPTKLVFDYAPGTATDRPLSGLLRHGPFDSSKFDRKSPRILLMFREKNRGAMTDFFGRLVEGVPESKFFSKGFRDLFSLHDVRHSLSPIRGDTSEDYEEALDLAIRNTEHEQYDLVIVECDDESENSPPQQNPYLRTKVRAMAYGLPIQSVRESHIRSSSMHENTLGPLALQLYAKLGGQPWRLPSSHTVDRELIIGLGSSLHRSNAWQAAKQSRVVGLTTFFLGDGRYVLGENLPAVDYGEYFEKLLEHLDQSLTQLSDEYGWKEGENVRIVFHVFKPLKGIEIDVVDQLIKKFTKYNIIYAFVTVALEHPWMMYDSIRSDRGKNKIQACDRGTNLVLDEYTCLLQLKGNKHRTNWKHRPPLPVKVRLHERSTYRDLQYISQQVLDFSFLSWRGFFPNELPVTIFYSQLMAKLTSKLEQVQGWNPVVIDRHFRRKKWFL